VNEYPWDAQWTVSNYKLPSEHDSKSNHWNVHIVHVSIFCVLLKQAGTDPDPLAFRHDYTCT